jgi:guanylate kinase
MQACELNPILSGDAPPALLIVISGPSGVGKDSLVTALRRNGSLFHFVVTATSRPARPGEVNGVDYHFVGTERFEQMIRNDELLEWAEVYGQYKGIPKAEISDALASGRDVMLRINVDGAATMKQLIPQAVFIFVAPPSADELRQRLAARMTEDEAQLQQRLAVAADEMEQICRFDYVVVNHDGRLDDAAAQVHAIIQAEKQRVQPRRPAL